MAYSSSESHDRLDKVSQKVTESILSIDPHEIYGGDGREAVGAVLIARLATALVSVERERRDSHKAASLERQETHTKTIAYAPVIPRLGGG
jgi:hypothetical protein